MFTEELYHYGTPRHSGRYPWGSGENPQRSKDFLSYVKEMQDKGLSEKEIAETLQISTTELRARKSAETERVKAANATQILDLKDKGYSNVKIGEIMGMNESTVRLYLEEPLKRRARVAENTAEELKRELDHNRFIDIGAGVENELKVSSTRLKTAVSILQDQDYEVYNVPIEQLGTGHKTTIKVLAPPGSTWAEVYNNMDQIGVVSAISNAPVDTSDETLARNGLRQPKSLDSSRIKIVYKEDGGSEKDGVIELRKGVEDISLGGSLYAQVRIAVDDKYYLKGMAMYTDDIPDGYDVVFNTNKSNKKSMAEVLKPLKDDPNNPFGATIKKNGQREYVDENGETQLSVINKVNEEGDWGTWSKTLSAQFLSKQPKQLISRQLDLAYLDKKSEFEDIMALTNPEIKHHLLSSFADGCDASAVDLKAAALPRQGSYVILPVKSLKETEVYAPNYKNGEHVVLVRYPHGGTFEIPELVVNNKQPEANSLLKGAKDAIGINSKVAQKLSGADFDGDTVLVIPVNDKVKVKTSAPLAGLKDFDPKESYPGYSGMKVMSDARKQQEMGKVTNLITDMTLKGANPDEITRAVRHSMVVIDAVKHKLNYEQSYIDNGIAELKETYQGGARRGASTLISRASSVEYVPQRKDYYDIDPDTGAKIFKPTGATSITYTRNKNGEIVNKKEKPKMQASTKMYEREDARSLSSGTKQEELYADYANKLKALANTARKAMVSIEPSVYEPTAAKTYAEEVASLKAKLNNALKNAPRERQAQIRATQVVNSKKKANPQATAEDVKKWKGQELARARLKVGASKQKIEVTDREWEAIQSHAITSTTLTKILNNTDTDKIKERAMPRKDSTLSDVKVNRIKALARSGYTSAEIAEAMGVSATTVNKYV